MEVCGIVDSIVSKLCPHQWTKCSNASRDVHYTSGRISTAYSFLYVQDAEFAGYGMDTVLYYVLFSRLPFAEHGGK